MDPGVFLAVAVVLAVVGVGYAMFRDRAADRALREAVPARGWRIRDGASPSERWVVEGEHDGVPWSVTGRQRTGGDHGSGTRQETVFVAPAPPLAGVVLVGPKLPSALAGLDLGGGVVQLLLRQVLGAEAADLAPTRPVDLPAPLADRYSAIGSDDAEADRLLGDAALVAALDGWPGAVRPVVLRWKDRVEVRVQERVRDPAALERLVAVGTRALAASLR